MKMWTVMKMSEVGEGLQTLQRTTRTSKPNQTVERRVFHWPIDRENASCT